VPLETGGSTGNEAQTFLQDWVQLVVMIVGRISKNGHATSDDQVIM